MGVLKKGSSQISIFIYLLAMCASYYNSRPGSRSSHGSFSSHPDGLAVVQVQVKNLNKRTTRGDIKSRLRHFKVIDVKLIIRRNRRTNYAYIHLQDYDTAERVVKAVHDRMEIHSNILKAVLKEEKYIVHTRSSQSVSRPPQAKPADIDTSLVELLIHDKENTVTESELKLHFTKYGEIDFITAMHDDYPRATNIRFTSAVSAHAARYESPHTVCKALVVALPPPRGGEVESAVMTKEFACNPLVVADAVKDLSQELHNEPRLKILARRYTIVVHVQEEMDDLEEQKILRIIRISESKISRVKMELDLHFLPMLAEQETQKLISAFTEPFELRILRGREAVSLEQLTQDYSDGQGDMAGTAAFRQYLSPSTSASSKVRHQWHWQDDDKLYQPYSGEVNKRIERGFERKSHCLQEIGKFLYIINGSSMTQTNVVTGKSRPLRRQQIHSEVTLVLALTLSSHENHLQHLRRALHSTIARFCTETIVEVPDTAMQASSFQDVVEKLKKNAIKVTLDEDQNSVVSIQGKPILVRTAEVQLHKVILKIVAEKSIHVTMPKTWELQSKKCELKSITRGTPEWNTIQDQMLQPDLRVRIVKIERIQNTWLWELFQLSKKRMSEKNDGDVNEKALFHGTRKTPPKDIYDSEQGFDSRLASQGLWGEGTYFAAMAKYSDTYAHPLSNGHKQMFLAQVITGVSCKFSSSDSSLKAPPKKEERRSFLSSLFWTHTSKFEGERYDSVTATSNGSKIYVIYELGRVYPAYLITYSNV